MAPRSTRKCPMCTNSNQIEEMIFDEKTKRWYCKVKCHPIFLKKQEWQANENREWVELYEYIKSLHDLINIPPQHIKRLQSLRAGQKLINGEYVQSWKSGPSYSLILTAYKLGNSAIKQAFHEKIRDKRDHGAISYCISIAEGNLNKALSERQKKKEQDMIVQRVTSQEKEKKVYVEKETTIQEPVSFTKKKDKLDISNFL